MKKIIILIVSYSLMVSQASSQKNDSIQSKLTDLFLTGKLTLSVRDTQKILLENSGKAYFDGKISAREIEVKTNVWADYVFNKDYKLLPLMELQKYIKENKKLPEIPYEKEALNGGVNLGKMDVLLLQKIEELTLYIINQQKEIEELKKEINGLKK